LTRNEFLVESIDFLPGKIVVVSCSDLDSVVLLLQDVRDSILDLTENECVVANSRDELQYFSDEADRNIMFEHFIISNPSSVLLVANLFDIDNMRMNYANSGNLHVDVVSDLINRRLLEMIPLSGSRLYFGIRGLFPYISKVYHFDGNDSIKFIKNQESFL
jgi:hypothetical protein